jgi:ribosomal RNA-processing protein 12
MVMGLIFIPSNSSCASRQTTICGGLRLLCQSLSWEAAEGDYEDGSDRSVMSQVAVQILPVLFKLVSDSTSSYSSNSQQDIMQIETDTVDDSVISAFSSVSSEHLQCVVDTIATLARVAPQTFLQSLFKKLMYRVVDSMQSEACDSERLCPLLSLSQGLVSARVLEESEVSLLYRSLKPLIRNDSHGARVQKRAYKVIAEVCEKYHAFFTEPERLKELTNLFGDTMMASSVSARSMRLKCIHLLVDGFNGSESGQLVSCT